MLFRLEERKACRKRRIKGFKKVGTLPAYFKIGEEYIDFDSMVLDLR